jgi:RNA polymerase sigma factor (sigma-70 family)
VAQVARASARSEERIVLSPKQFEDYYRLHRDSVLRALALTLRDPDLAAEAADEAMARTYQHWRSVSGYANPAGWTYRVGLNWARSRFRKRRREVPESSFEPPAWDPEPFDPGLARAIGALPVHARSVVVLRYFLDWSLEDIGQALNVPVGTAKSRLHRALQQLRSTLEVRS